MDFLKVVKVVASLASLLSAFHNFADHLWYCTEYWLPTTKTSHYENEVYSLGHW